MKTWMFWRIYVGLLLALLVFGYARAACTPGEGTSTALARMEWDGTWHNGPLVYCSTYAACNLDADAIVEAWMGAYDAHTVCMEVTTTDPETNCADVTSWSGHSVSIGSFSAVDNEGHSFVGGFVVNDAPGQVCPEPEACSGLAADGVGDVFTSSVVPGSGPSWCNPVSHCKMTAVRATTIDGTSVYNVRHTSDSCSGAEPDPGDDLSTGESCASGSGAEFCLSKQGENCGYLNDNFVCLPQVSSDSCKVFGDGSRVCGSNAPTPPAPDNGTPGERASPDEQITVTNNSTNTTLNFYNSSTVGASNRDPGDTGENPFGDGDGDGEGEEPGECPEGATCDGTVPELDDEVCTFQECTETLISRIEGSPLIESLADVDESWPAGECPDWSFELWDQDLSFSDGLCTFWTSIGSTLGSIFLIIFAWLGTRIVLSA